MEPSSLGIQSYSQLIIGVSNHLLSIVFRFHYHSQKVIGSSLLCFLISLPSLRNQLTGPTQGICHDFALDVFDGHVFGGYLEWFVHGLALWSILQYDATLVARESLKVEMMVQAHPGFVEGKYFNFYGL